MTSILLLNPAYSTNLASAVRACACWGVEDLIWSGNRIDLESEERIPRELRMRDYRNSLKRFWHVTTPIYPWLKTWQGSGYVIVGVEYREQSENLVDFAHPDKALYIFGPEDGSIPQGILSQCHRFVKIPTHFPLNLAAAINVVLYDRHLKKEHVR